VNEPTAAPRRVPWRARLLAFAPSLAFGLVGVVAWLLLRPDPTPRLQPLPSLALGLAVGALLLAAAALLERTVPSFAWVSRTTERALRRLALPHGVAALLALATSVGEELLFRGVLLPTIGLVPQALLFGALHPAGRRGWSYPLFVAASGLLLGGLVVVTGRVAAAIVAHAVVNGVGLLRSSRSVPPLR